ncbi:hypothetical protein GCM10020331_093110 [Ectobacillus funiculus]
MNNDNRTLTSTEMFSVWISYLNDSMSKSTLAYFFIKSRRVAVTLLNLFMIFVLVDKGELVKKTNLKVITMAAKEAKHLDQVDKHFEQVDKLREKFIDSFVDYWQHYSSWASWQFLVSVGHGCSTFSNPLLFL